MTGEPLTRKYLVSRPDGTPIEDQDAFFVLKLSTDSAARDAAREYARNIRRYNPLLARDLIRRCDEYDYASHLDRRNGDGANGGAR